MQINIDQMTPKKDIGFGGLTIEEIEVGMRATYSHTVTDADVKSYAGLSGDNNPVHMSDEYAANSRFGARIAHGLYSVGFFSALFGTRLPGPGCVYVAQSIRFKLPVFLGDTVVAEVIVSSIDTTKRRVFFNTICKVKGRVVIEGKRNFTCRNLPALLENNLHPKQVLLVFSSACGFLPPQRGLTNPNHCNSEVLITMKDIK